MTCVYPLQLAQNEAYSPHNDMCYIASNYYRPLPSVLINFLAETMCGLLPLYGPRRTAISNRVLPELLFFIEKVTTQAGVNVHVAVVALIYIYRLKRRLRKDMVGGYGTAHRIFIAALLVASKILHETTWAPVSCASRNDRFAAVTPLPLLTNRKLSEICLGVYNVRDINRMEREFLRLIEYECWVDGNAVQSFLEEHRDELLL